MDELKDQLKEAIGMECPLKGTYRIMQPVRQGRLETFIAGYPNENTESCRGCVWGENSCPGVEKCRHVKEILQ